MGLLECCGLEELQLRGYEAMGKIWKRLEVLRRQYSRAGSSSELQAKKTKRAKERKDPKLEGRGL